MVRGVKYGDLGDFLRAQNQQLTERRRTIWAIMCTGGGQLTAEQITEKARRRDPGIDRTTVDRTLNLFADMGSALQTPAEQEREPRWEIVHRGEHFHLTCELCGDIRHHTGVLAENVRTHLADRYAFSATQMNLEVLGVCGRCGSGAES
ncbi:MAG: transcriptional repressor [bacterium]|nr:transcriptional repressor [bacterium]MDE0601353.1 transcriptional repressor [bacterium]